jgi:hypothetical protein
LREALMGRFHAGRCSFPALVGLQQIWLNAGMLIY